VHDCAAPLRTVTTAKGGEFVLVAPALVQTGYGEAPGQRPRCLDLGKPLGTVVSGQKHALVAAFLAKHYGGPRAVPGQTADRPMGTVTTVDHHAVVQASLFPAEVDRRPDVRAFLVKYYGSDGAVEAQQQSLFGPLHTVTTRARFGLVRIEGEDYEIADIGMRMLAPHELFAAQGFPADYVIDFEHAGKRVTKTQQIELAGNAVCPPVAQALVAANVLGAGAMRGAA
jgi:DNA (cytosine-5)-methyltransferase 1